MAGRVSGGPVTGGKIWHLEIDNIIYILYTGNDNKNISGVPGIMTLIG